ncbi:hypothetical protein IW262DRAFT_1536554 [Armillaria fumosa]|nr:hypothetical protein IW262DRAFT_1536554 [Armillaria fumosa]
MSFYTLPYPDIPIVSLSLFTHLLHKSYKESKLVGGHPVHSSVFVDSVTGTALTRGDTSLVFSPNALAYPVVLLGAIAAGLRCTLANNAYTSHKLVHQYTDSWAWWIFTTEDSLPVVCAMFEEISVKGDEADAKIIIHIKGLKFGLLEEEEKFDGECMHETALFLKISGIPNSRELPEYFRLRL